MAANELVDYLELGNIKNSVNFPAASLPYGGGTRVCVLHKNVPAVISQLTTVLSDAGLNIANMVNASKKDNAYTLMEVEGNVGDDIAAKLSGVESVVRVRVIAK